MVGREIAMKAYKCDRCNKLFERDYVPDIRIEQYCHGYDGVRKYLCPECQAELEKWLKEGVDDK